MTRHPFVGQLAAAWNPQEWRDVTVIVAVSAGADSVALLRGLASLRQAGDGRLVVAHFNHRLRGTASNEDEAFTRSLCDQLGLALEVGSPTGPSPKADESSEATARAARYAFFEHVAKAQGARFVATAHTADDQAETILHRIIRGTGIGGLAGIPRTRLLTANITMLRPLLSIPRREVLDFLESLLQPFREDASNRDPRFTRNRIRAELLPDLADAYNPRVREALLRLGRLAADSRQVIEALGHDLLARCVTQRDANQIQIGCDPLAPFPPEVAREMLMIVWKLQSWPLQAMSFDHWNQLALMTRETPNEKHRTLPGNIAATRQGTTLSLTRLR